MIQRNWNGLEDGSYGPEPSFPTSRTLSPRHLLVISEFCTTGRSMRRVTPDVTLFPRKPALSSQASAVSLSYDLATRANLYQLRNGRVERRLG